MSDRDIIIKTEKLIDDLKSVCSLNGIGNSPSEYKVISQIFLYKYLNDKFIHEVKRVNKKFNENTTVKEVEQYLNNIEPKEYQLLTMKMNPNVARVQKEYMISYLYNNQNVTEPEFYTLFDKALLGISNDNIDIFSVKTGGKEFIKLFDNLSQYILEENKKNFFFRAIINKLVGFSFEEAFEEKYDFFATIFEYLIKDYNKDFGKYAEYYTPNSIARIIAKILSPNPIQNVTLYDPAAGSGTLLLALAHQIGEENCTIYSQDISQKSNEFLRLNLILNNLVHSLSNVIHGDTLVSPAHLNADKNKLAQFDYIVSNPPFKTDFSDTRNTLAGEKYRERFCCGVPSIPKKDIDKMPIYVLFIQHILYSLKDSGKAAIVVPTGFLTSKTGVERKVLQYIVDNNYIKGVISMPSNVFANTGTNVSILLIEKNRNESDVFLIDASDLGEKIKEGKKQRTILHPSDLNKITDTYLNKIVEKDFSVLVDNNDIKENNYYLNPGQYFDFEIPCCNLTKDEFNKYLDDEINNLKDLFNESNELEKVILKKLKDIKYDL